MPSNTNPVYNPPPITQADLDEHNIQALVELSYVKEANNVIYGALGSLETSLAVTADAVQSLTTLQNLHNYINASSKSAFNFDYAGNSGNYSDAYSNAASAYFGTPIDPYFTLSANDPAFPDMQQQLIDMKKHIKSVISALAVITPTLSGGQPDPNTLLAGMQQVYKDLDNYDLTTYNGVKKWVLDNYTQHGSALASDAGLIQQHITLAIVSGENLNNTQTESVREYLFVFEEYYKSASGIMNQINQIITKMAGNISQ